MICKTRGSALSELVLGTCLVVKSVRVQSETLEIDLEHQDHWRLVKVRSIVGWNDGMRDSTHGEAGINAQDTKVFAVVKPIENMPEISEMICHFSWLSAVRIAGR